MNFDNKLITDLVSEIRKEQLINPNIPSENFERYVLYANYKRLAEFKELYMSDYVALQIKYNNDSEL